MAGTSPGRQSGETAKCELIIPKGRQADPDKIPVVPLGLLRRLLRLDHGLASMAVTCHAFGIQKRNFRTLLRGRSSSHKPEAPARESTHQRKRIRPAETRSLQLAPGELLRGRSSSHKPEAPARESTHQRKRIRPAETLPRLRFGLLCDLLPTPRLTQTNDRSLACASG